MRAQGEPTFEHESLLAMIKDISGGPRAEERLELELEAIVN